MGKVKKIVDDRKDMLSPRQLAFVKSYTDCSSPTFGNAYQSALMANYSKEYAEVITKRLGKRISQKMSENLREEGITKEYILRQLKIISDCYEHPEKIKKLRKKGLMIKPVDITRHLELLGKWQKLFTDKVEHGGKPVIQIVRYGYRNKPENGEEANRD